LSFAFMSVTARFTQPTAAQRRRFTCARRRNA